ncbi:MAG: class I SAM-dependent methyltransferase [Myxococcaceae bacterium]
MLDYDLLDSGDGFKLERFGLLKLIRPDASALCKPKQPKNTWIADSICESLGKNLFAWQPNLEPWMINYGALKLELRLSQSKNIGIFPEQESNWKWLTQKIRPGSKILNLFAYTGAASLVCAQKGAQVCHVDASKAAVKWASDNAKLNNLKNIRWIVEDAQVFLKREIARKSTYDGLILDPPPFGKADKASFLFNRDILELLDLCKQVLKPEPELFLINSYAVNLKPSDLKNLVLRYFGKQKIEAGELRIGPLSLSAYARF